MKNLAAFSISLILFTRIKVLVVLAILCFIFMVKFIICVIKLILNEDTAFALSCMSVVSKETIKKMLNDKK